jgi:hypothetical protein
MCPEHVMKQKKTPRTRNVIINLQKQFDLHESIKYNFLGTSVRCHNACYTPLKTRKFMHAAVKYRKQDANPHSTAIYFPSFSSPKIYPSFSCSLSYFNGIINRLLRFFAKK